MNLILGACFENHRELVHYSPCISGEKMLTTVYESPEIKLSLSKLQTLVGQFKTVSTLFNVYCQKYFVL